MSYTEIVCVYEISLPQLSVIVQVLNIVNWPIQSPSFSTISSFVVIVIWLLQESDPVTTCGTGIASHETLMFWGKSEVNIGSVVSWIVKVPTEVE